MTVRAGSDVIEATPEHPFYIVGDTHGRDERDTLGEGWVKAKNLRAGDKLLLSDGSTLAVESVSARHLDTPVKVYNFEVEDFHTYYVGENSVLVHNVCASDRAIFHEWGKEYKRSGISANDATALWDLAVEYGINGHSPRYDSYGNGEVYHMKIYGYHINIY